MKLYKYFIVLFTFVFLDPFVVYAEIIEKVYSIPTTFSTVMDTIKDSNGHYYVVGNKNVLLKYNSKQQLIFSKTIEGVDGCLSVDVDSSNNVYGLCVHKRIFTDSHIISSYAGNSYVQVRLLKWNSAGNLIFNNIYDNVYDITEDHNELKVYGDRIYFVGTTDVYDRYLRTELENCYYDFDKTRYLYITDLSGNLINKVSVGTLEQHSEVIYHNTSSASSTDFIYKKYSSFLIDNNSLYLVTDGMQGEFFLGKYDLDGNKIWEKELGMGSANSFVDLTLSNDGNYITGGSILSNNILELPYNVNRKSPIIVKFSSAGDIVSYTVINGSGELLSIKNVDDGYYALVHLNDSNINDIQNPQAGYYLLKYDYNLNLKDSISIPASAIYLNDMDDSGIFVYENNSDLTYYGSNYNTLFEESTVVKVGEKKSLSEFFLDSSIDLLDSSIGWEILDDSILKISDGKIVPLKVGTTDIHAKIAKKDYTLHITVEEKSKEEVIDDNNNGDDNTGDNSSNNNSKDDGTNVINDSIKNIENIIKNPKTRNSLLIVIIVLASLIVFSLRKIKQFKLKKKY